MKRGNGVEHEIIAYVLPLLMNYDGDLQVGTIIGNERDALIKVVDMEVIYHGDEIVSSPHFESELFIDITTFSKTISGRLRMIIWHGALFSECIWSKFDQISFDQHKKEKSELAKLDDGE